MTSATTDAEFDAKNGIIHENIPRNVELKALYKKCFAYTTFRVRLPSTLQSIIENLAKDKDELVAIHNVTTADIEQVSKQVSHLRQDILNNGNLVAINDNEKDVALWNAFINQLPEDKRTYFQVCWLHSECYMYRRLSNIFKKTQTLATYDYFSKLKQTATQLSREAMEAVAKATRNTEKNMVTFQQLIKLNLWGNRCDLSITSGKQIKPSGNAFEQVKLLDENLLIDNSADIWQVISNNATSKVIDIVCDNAGYELYTDLILAEYIIDKGLAEQVRFNVKAIPWFISDVMAQDFYWILQFLGEQDSIVLSELSKKLTLYAAQRKFVLAPIEYFWTSPYEFYRMQEMNKSLYEALAEAKLVLFKGDLNYRKLIGDFSWDFTQSFNTCLRGFLPSNVCTLRTVKADLICGLRPGIAEALFEKNNEWMLTGEYGIIQLATK